MHDPLHPARSEDRHAAATLRRLLLATGLYVVAYLLVSYADLYTTGLALRQPGTVEGNVYATGADGYSSVKAWGITALGLLFIGGCLVWCLVQSRHVSEPCLWHPVRSFGKLYVLPWRRHVLDRSPLHMLSFVLAFPLLRLLAVGNNLMIHELGTGPIGWLVGVASNHTTPAVGFWLVLGPLFYLLAIGVSPLAAHLIRWYRHGPVRESVAPSFT
ncbi:MAG: hypothetical protein ABGY75_11785 [Gemmataceae bacterium]